jgi:hypothetical protein
MESRKAAIEWFSMLKEKFAKTEYEGYIDMAIAALEQQEKDRWRPFRCRKTTEDDCSSFDYIMDCELPEDGQEILITVNNNRHEPVQMDTFFGGSGEECALDSGYDLCDEAVAWRPLPEPYQEDKE